MVNERVRIVKRKGLDAAQNSVPLARTAESIRTEYAVDSASRFTWTTAVFQLSAR